MMDVLFKAVAGFLAGELIAIALIIYAAAGYFILKWIRDRL